MVEILLAEDEGVRLRIGKRESLTAQMLIAGEAIDGRLQEALNILWGLVSLGGV